MHVVVTGAANGIGLAIATRFAQTGAELTVTDCDAPALDRAATLIRDQFKVRVRPIISDLSSPEQVERLIADLASGSAITHLIHNAGINTAGPFAACDIDEQARIVQVNLTTPMTLTAGVLKAAALEQRATIAFVCSLSCFVGYPGSAVYAAAKDGLAGYARSLRVALARSGFNVLTIFPGPTRTEQARRNSPDNSREERRMPPEELADQVFRAIQRRRRLLIPGAINRLCAAAGWLCPRLADRLMRRALFDRMPQ